MKLLIENASFVLTKLPPVVCGRYAASQIAYHHALSRQKLHKQSLRYSTSSSHEGRAALQNHCVDIFNSAIQSVSPTHMVHNSLRIDGNVLNVLGREYKLNKNVYVAAFGKAVIGMIRAADDILGDHLVKGFANVPVGIREVFRNSSKTDYLPLPSSRVHITEGAKDNMPDEAAHQGALKIYELAKSLHANDILLVLMSGGGSALLPAPAPPLSLDQITQVTYLLSRRGATILELNTIRKNLELLKGGGLAAAAAPAQVVSLILSDVIGDPLDFIASGPTVRNSNTPQQCLDLFQKFGIEPDVPQDVLDFLHDKAAQWSNENIGADTAHFDGIQNEIVGSNRFAVAAACKKAESLGYIPHVLSTSLDGEAEETGRMLTRLGVFALESLHQKSVKDHNLKGPSSELSLISSGVSKDSINEIRSLCSEARNTCKPICIVAAGETIVHVRGKGKGGRNQQLVLSAAMEMDEQVTNGSITNEEKDAGIFQLLSAGTDGQDGPTPVAGAMVDPHLVKRAFEQDLKAEDYIQDNDTFNFFSRLDGGKNLVNTGLTGTNVMDVQIILINPTYNMKHTLH